MTTSPRRLECVVNVSEGRDEAVLATLSASAGPALLDLHRDPHHHRAVLTLGGAPDDVATAARSLASATVRLLDLRTHEGVHPRLGVLDVVPFVPYEPGRTAPNDLTAAVAHRDDFARWLGDELGVPSFSTGPFPAAGTGPCRTSAATRSPRPRASRPTSVPRGPTPARAPPPSAPAGCSWPTTSGSPRSRSPA